MLERFPRCWQVEEDCGSIRESKSAQTPRWASQRKGERRTRRTRIDLVLEPVEPVLVHVSMLDSDDVFQPVSLKLFPAGASESGVESSSRERHFSRQPDARLSKGKGRGETRGTHRALLNRSSWYSKLWTWPVLPTERASACVNDPEPVPARLVDPPRQLSGREGEGDNGTDRPR